MEDYRRYAVYYAPEPGSFAERSAAWLGWDPARAAPVPQPELSALGPVDGLAVNLHELTAEPRRYGFHGTLKPPFRLANTATRKALEARIEALAKQLAPVEVEGLCVKQIGGFLALCPTGDAAPIEALAAEVVRVLDGFRAPLSREDLAKRPPARLTPRQRALQLLFGYPYVLEEFRFHLTLTGRLPAEAAEPLAALLSAQFEPVLPKPFRITELCLFGEPVEGPFRLLQRFRLSG